MSKRSIRYILGVVLLLVLNVSSVLAVNDFYISNNIYFYSRGKACNVTSSPAPISSSGQLSKAVDYKNREVFSEADLKAIQENSSFYKKAADKVGIPWEMIAVVHKRESNLGRYNPENGQGVYQFVNKNGGPYPEGPVSNEEFQRQTDLAAEFLLGKAQGGGRAEKLKSGDDDAVKYTFFAYNGIAEVYIEQGRRLGFSGAENGEGSPYVMNQADAKRDPDENPTGWGQITRDYGSIGYPANKDHGAFVMYAALKGKISVGGCGSDIGDIHGDGLNEEQAKKFMMAYGENKNGFSEKHSNGLWRMGPIPTEGLGGSNCVTFSVFFNNAFTDITNTNGNGNMVVRNISTDSRISTGTEPKVFSTFSLDYDVAGHTGIVLGKTSDGKLIVGHASYGHTGIGRGDGTYNGGGAGFITTGDPKDGNTWLSGVVPYGFAYPNKVDTEKIKQFIEGKL